MRISTSSLQFQVQLLLSLHVLNKRVKLFDSLLFKVYQGNIFTLNCLWCFPTQFVLFLFFLSSAPLSSLKKQQGLSISIATSVSLLLQKDVEEEKSTAWF